MHSLPGTRPLTVPDIGFSQNISISLCPGKSGHDHEEGVCYVERFIAAV